MAHSIPSAPLIASQTPLVVISVPLSCAPATTLELTVLERPSL